MLRLKQLGEFVGAGNGGVLLHEVHALDGDDDCFCNIITALRVGQDFDVLRVGEITQKDLYHRHLRQAQEIPGAAMVRAVLQIGAGHDFTLDEAR